MTNDAERLAYEITVIAPGTKSQNWYGALFDKNGKPIQVPSGQTVKLNVGEFVSVAQSHPGKPYGMIHADMLRWMKTASGNVIMDSEPWAYRLYVAREGSKSEGWRGELLHGRGVIGAPGDGAPAATPMGRTNGSSASISSTRTAGSMSAGRRARRRVEGGAI